MPGNPENPATLVDAGVHPDGRTERPGVSGAGQCAPVADNPQIESPRPDYARPPVRWVLQQYMLDRVPPGQRSLLDAANDAGMMTHVVQYVDLTENQFRLPIHTCAVTWGSHQFVRAFDKVHREVVQPGSYCRTENLSYSAYAPYLGDLMLNDDFVLLPFGEVVRRRITKPIFLKPDAVTKAFTGLVITPEDFDHEINSLRQLHHIQNDLLCVVADPKPIDGEFRFVISRGKVVTGSEYRWDGRLDVRSDVHPACLEVASLVAQRAWQADHVYTCDVALSEGRGRVVELNSFSAAGLYACDVDAIVKEVSEAAWAEYEGDI